MFDTFDPLSNDRTQKKNFMIGHDQTNQMIDHGMIDHHLYWYIVKTVITVIMIITMIIEYNHNSIIHLFYICNTVSCFNKAEFVRK